MTRKLVLFAAAGLMAASARAHYRAYPTRRHWRHHGYAWREPRIWRYQRSFRSNATDFYGAREFRGP
jgi:hypothetical protein